MKKSAMIERAYDIMLGEDNIEIVITQLIAEGMLMPPCNRYGDYEWEAEDVVNATDTRSTEPSN